MSDIPVSEKPPIQQLLHKELVEGLSRLLQKASDNQDAIVSGEIDELTREFYLVTKSGERQFVGIVARQGEPGDDGVSIIDVQLVEDPEQAGRVFFETELSNGVILQTRNSIEGYNGKSLDDARIEDNQIIFILEGGIELDPISVDGLRPVSVSDAYVNEEKEVIFKLTDDSELSLGLADQFKTAGIEEIYRENGRLYIKYDVLRDNELVDLGRLVGLTSIKMVEGKLTVTTDDDEVHDLGPVVGLTRAAVEENHLVFYTNQTGEEERWDVGKVENLRGDDGLSVAGFDVRDNTIYITLEDGTELDPVPVTGLRPIHVVGAEFNAVESELFLRLSNDELISTGIGADFKGDGIEYLSFDSLTGEIKTKYTKEADEKVSGIIPTLQDLVVQPTGEIELTWSHLDDPVQVAVLRSVSSIGENEEGRLIATYNTEEEVDLGDIKSIRSIDRDDTGMISATFSNDEVVELGTLKSIASIDKDETGLVQVTLDTDEVLDVGYIKSIESIEISGDDLLVTLTGEEPVAIGSLRGEKGDEGTSISTASVNDKGNLILEYDDGKVIDAGYVRTTINNFLGENREFKWSDGPDYPAAHAGSVLFFAGNDIIPVSDLSLDVEDTVTYTGSATYPDDTVVTITSFIIGAADETGRGVFEINSISSTEYQIKLEDGTLFTIDTETVIDPDTLPPGIETAAIDPTTSMLTITKTDGEVIEVGVVNSSDNTESVYIDDLGELHVVLNSGKDMNAGSVVSNMTISEIKIDENGDLLIWLKGATEPFNAGPTANYVTNSYVNENDRLFIETSDGRSIDAGTVRNPLLGTVYEFIGIEGQTKFRLDHGEYSVDASLQGIGLFKDQLDLTDPQYVTLVDPIVRDGQRLKVTLMSKGEFTVNQLESAKTAPTSSFYGVDEEGNAGFHPTHNRLAATPSNINARQEGDTEISHYNSGLIDVYKNGSLMHSGYRNNDDNTKIIFDTPLSTTDEIRVIDYSKPQVSNSLLVANYARVVYRTFSPGGTFQAGSWRVRDINAVFDNQINLEVRNNRMILQPGTYYIRGYATCKGVGQNILKLYNQSTQSDVLVGGAQFAPIGAGRQYQQSDEKTEIMGYFEITDLSAVILMHKCTVTSSTYGFGSGNAGGGAPGIYEDRFDDPGRLVDLEIWKV